MNTQFLSTMQSNDSIIAQMDSQFHVSAQMIRNWVYSNFMPKINSNYLHATTKFSPKNLDFI